MSFTTALANTTANTAAYAKHAALSTGLHATKFGREYSAGVSAQYAVKDRELAARRAELSAARTAVAAIPSRKPRQNKMTTA